MDVYIVCDIHTGMTEELWQNLNVDPFVEAIGGESVPEYVLPTVFNVGCPICALGLIAQNFVSPNGRFDLVISQSIIDKVYDIYVINATFFRYEQPILW